jgi:hypothetical protein
MFSQLCLVLLRGLATNVPYIKAMIALCCCVTLLEVDLTERITWIIRIGVVPASTSISSRIVLRKLTWMSFVRCRIVIKFRLKSRGNKHLRGRIIRFQDWSSCKMTWRHRNWWEIGLKTSFMCQKEALKIWHGGRYLMHGESQMVHIQYPNLIEYRAHGLN